VGEAHLVEVFDAVADLAEDAVYLWAAHFTRHDDAEEIKGSIFHNLVGESIPSGHSLGAVLTS